MEKLNSYLFIQEFEMKRDQMKLFLEQKEIQKRQNN